MSFATDVSVREPQRPAFAVISAAPSRCEGCASENYLYTESQPKVEGNYNPTSEQQAGMLKYNEDSVEFSNWSPTLEHSPIRDP